MGRPRRIPRLLAHTIGLVLLLASAACAPRPMMRPTVAHNDTAAPRQPGQPVERCVGTLCFTYDEPGAVAQR